MSSDEKTKCLVLGKAHSANTSLRSTYLVNFQCSDFDVVRQSVIVTQINIVYNQPKIAE